MNRLSVPIGILVVIVVALAVWFVVSEHGAPSAPQQTATTTATTGQAPVTVEQTPSQPVTLDPATVAGDIVGSWQSTDDPNYQIQVTASGKWTDTYAGADASSATQTGTYELFTSANPDKDFTGVLVPGVVYLKVTENNLSLYYSVQQANGTNFQISYLDRGNTLSFVKVQ
jgi:hypothetical protein